MASSATGLLATVQMLTRYKAWANVGTFHAVMALPGEIAEHGGKAGFCRWVR